MDLFKYNIKFSIALILESTLILTEIVINILLHLIIICCYYILN